MTSRLLVCALLALTVAPTAARADEPPRPAMSIQQQALALAQVRLAPRPGGRHGRAPRLSSAKPILIGAAIGTGLFGALALTTVGGDGISPVAVTATGAALGAGFGFAVALR